MKQRLISILILFSFLIVGNSRLLASDVGKLSVAIEQSADEQPDDEKEPKPIEYADEEYLPAGLTFSSYHGVSLKLQHHTFDPTAEVYFTLPYPPPELHS